MNRCINYINPTTKLIVPKSCYCIPKECHVRIRYDQTPKSDDSEDENYEPPKNWKNKNVQIPPLQPLSPPPTTSNNIPLLRHAPPPLNTSLSLPSLSDTIPPKNIKSDQQIRKSLRIRSKLPSDKNPDIMKAKLLKHQHFQ